jgi:L-aspartate oxidase
MDMEFFQFHPTALRLPGVQPFLISEAVRGEGGTLVDTDGVRFMPAYDERGELAPRDIVARAILDRMERTGSDHVLLDVTSAFGGEAARVIARFPQIYRFCLDHGLDITREPVPVSPAAHYTMGGVRTNVWGETNIAGLYACGECACTGVHGANRLASNSLLETVVFAKRVVHRTLAAAAAAKPAAGAVDLPPPQPAEACPEPVLSNVEGPCRRAPPLSREALQSLMWEQVGIVRDGGGLSRARATLSAWQASLATPTDRPSQELADLLLCGRLVTEAALMREESRGAHYRSDFPQPRDEWRRHIVFRKGAPFPRSS